MLKIWRKKALNSRVIWTSRGLKKPVKISAPWIVNLIKGILEEKGDFIPVFKNEFCKIRQFKGWAAKHKKYNSEGLYKLLYVFLSEYRETYHSFLDNIEGFAQVFKEFINSDKFDYKKIYEEGAFKNEVSGL